MAATRFPNVILFVLDTARADAFEPYGAPAGTTPVIAGLAKQGSATQRAIAPCNWTLPSHASMFSGLLPGALGLASSERPRTASGMISRLVLDQHRERLLASVLAANGFDTRGVSANPWITEGNGFATGFARFASVRGRPIRTGTGLRSRMERLLDAWVARADDGAGAIEQILDSWMDEQPAGPFFWFVNLMECHSPYLPPRPWNDLGLLGRIRAAREAEEHLTIDAMLRYCLGKHEIPDDALARMRALYGRSVSLMDALIGRVAEKLERRGLLSETIIIVTSDHGENLGENHLVSHLVSMDERLLRVPLVFSGPGSVPNQALVSGAELPRLIAEAAGLPAHPWTDNVRPEGVAVAQASAEMLLPITEQVSDAWNLSEEAVRDVATTMTSATDGRWKLVREPSGDHLYDLDADPAERTRIDPGSAPDADAVARLRSAIDRTLAQTVSPGVDDAPGPAADADEQAALEERMRLLGYL